MVSNLKKGSVIAGFEILEIVALTELEALGVFAKHQKSGLELFHIYNDDDENLFAYTFATAPEDSSGIAHILEHSVLCGSKNYRLKDPFAVLAQGSLQTYLNAWTFSDKTVYPASSVNELDYFNLMSVYGDAVFRPLLDEWTFMQEGYRLEYNKGEAASDKKGRLSLTGVVFNEMKGAYSELDEYAQHWSLKSVLPNTPYAFDSGGDPQCIPDLTYQAFRDFHKKRYVPANCKIFLAGNIPTEKQLCFLNEQILSDLDAGLPAPCVPLEEKWSKPRSYLVDVPAASDNKSTVFISWLCGDDVYKNPGEMIKLSALTEVLLGHDGSPLMRTLIESSLGEDIAPVSGLEFELRQMVWTLGLRGVARETNEKEIEALIFDELKRLVKEGIPKEEIEAALLSLEFSQREIKRAGGPWSLVLLRRSLRGWLHHCKPWETLLFEPDLEILKNDIKHNPRYFESLIQSFLLDNPHRALVVARPQADFLEKQDAALQEQLLHKEQTLSKSDLKKIKQKSAELTKIQNKPDSPGLLQKIPHLSLKDLSPDIEIIPRTLHDVGGIPVLSHKIRTNGISYCDFAIPYDVLSAADYIYLPLFFHCISSLGIPGMDYAEVSSLLARTIGDVHVMPHSGSPAAETLKLREIPFGNPDLIGRDWLVLRLKTLDEKIAPSVELVLRIVKEADFSDLRRLRDLVLELKNQADSSLAPHGSIFAATRSARFSSLALAKAEVCSGLTQIMSYHAIAEMDIVKISSILSRIRDELFLKNGMIVSITGEAEKENLAAIEKYCTPFGPPKVRNPETMDIAGFLKTSCTDPGVNKSREIFSSASLQIGFAAMSLCSSAYTERESVTEQLLAHYLSTGPLWESIRMKGGAYGAHTSIDPLEKVFQFTTYRDPLPLQSLEIFPSILKKAASVKIDENTMEKTIIGSYAKIKQPRTGMQKGWIDLIHLLYGIEYEDRLRRLSWLLKAKPKDLSDCAGTLYERVKEGKTAIISSRAETQKIADRLKLPVKDIGV